MTSSTAESGARFESHTSDVMRASELTVRRSLLRRGDTASASRIEQICEQAQRLWSQVFQHCDLAIALSFDDRTFFRVRDSARHVGDAQSGSSELIGYWVDISEHKRARQALQAQQAELEKLQRQLVAGHTTPRSRTNSTSRLTPSPRTAKRHYVYCAPAMRSQNSRSVPWKAACSRRNAPDRSCAICFPFCIHAQQRPVPSISHSVCAQRSILSRRKAAKRLRSAWMCRWICRGRAMALQVQKVLLNLLHNSVEALQGTPDSDLRISVPVRQAEAANFLRVSVSDHGGGVAERNATQIFQPFFSTKSRGVGMGLAVSRSLIEAQGGKLWLDRHSSPGACFHFTLPVAP